MEAKTYVCGRCLGVCETSHPNPHIAFDVECGEGGRCEWQEVQVLYACHDVERKVMDMLNEEELKIAFEAINAMERDVIHDLSIAVEKLVDFNDMLKDAVGRGVMDCNLFALAVKVRDAYIDIVRQERMEALGIDGLLSMILGGSGMTAIGGDDLAAMFGVN